MQSKTLIIHRICIFCISSYYGNGLLVYAFCFWIWWRWRRVCVATLWDFFVTSIAISSGFELCVLQGTYMAMMIYSFIFDSGMFCLQHGVLSGWRSIMNVWVYVEVIAALQLKVRFQPSSWLPHDIKRNIPHPAPGVGISWPNVLSLIYFCLQGYGVQLSQVWYIGTMQILRDYTRRLAKYLPGEQRPPWFPKPYGTYLSHKQIRLQIWIYCTELLRILTTSSLHMSPDIPHLSPGLRVNTKTVCHDMGISILKIRRSHARLIFIMEVGMQIRLFDIDIILRYLTIILNNTNRDM